MKKNTSQSFLVYRNAFWASRIQSYSNSLFTSNVYPGLINPMPWFFWLGGSHFKGDLSLLGVPPLIITIDNRGLLIRGWHYPTVLAHAIFSTPNVSQTFRLPKRWTYSPWTLPVPGAHPDPRSHLEDAEGFVASDAARFPHPKSAQRISNAPSGSPRFLEGTIKIHQPKIHQLHQTNGKRPWNTSGIYWPSLFDVHWNMRWFLNPSCDVMLYHFIGITCFWNSPQVQ